MERIASAKNPSARLLRSLKDRAAREETGLFLVEGEKLILEALACGLRMRLLLAEERLQAFAEALPGDGARALADRSVMEAVCDTKTPQGVCAAFEVPAPAAPEALRGSVVALDGVQDPGNVGTIWRTADAAGLSAMLLGPGCADPLSPKVQRAAMGSGFRVPFAQVSDLPGALAGLRGRGYAVVASALDGANWYGAAKPEGPFCLIVGSEAHGVSPGARRQASLTVKLPMRGGAESLNAAVAAGILMYGLTAPEGK